MIIRAQSTKEPTVGVSADPVRLLTEGDTVRDTYEVERFLGEGAFAEVIVLSIAFLAARQ